MSASELYQQGNHPDGVRAICPQCEPVVLKDSERAAWDIVEQHNEQQHDGDDVAGVCEWDVPSIDEMLAGLSDRERLTVLINTFGENDG